MTKPCPSKYTCTKAITSTIRLNRWPYEQISPPHDRASQLPHNIAQHSSATFIANFPGSLYKSLHQTSHRWLYVVKRPLSESYWTRPRLMIHVISNLGESVDAAPSFGLLYPVGSKALLKLKTGLFNIAWKQNQFLLSWAGWAELRFAKLMDCNSYLIDRQTKKLVLCHNLNPFFRKTRIAIINIWFVDVSETCPCRKTFFNPNQLWEGRKNNYRFFSTYSAWEYIESSDQESDYGDIPIPIAIANALSQGETESFNCTRIPLFWSPFKADLWQYLPSFQSSQNASGNLIAKVSSYAFAIRAKWSKSSTIPAIYGRI